VEIAVNTITRTHTHETGMPSRANEQERFASFIEELLTTGSAGRIERELADLTVPEPFRLRIKALYSPFEPFDVVVRLARHASVGSKPFLRGGPPPPEPWRLQQPRTGTPGFVLTGAWGRDVVRPFKVPFALLGTDQPNVRAAITICTNDEWQLFLRFVRWQYPELVPIYLTQKELLESVAEYRDSAAGFDVRVRQYMAHERLLSGAVQRTVREWTDEQLQTIIEQISERQQRIQWITLAFYRQLDQHVSPAPSLSAKVTRDGRVEITGKFQLAKDTIVRPLAEIGATKLALYAGRGMRHRQYTPAPLRINFGRDIFAQEGELARLLESIKAFPNSMYSVQHGNPYLHVRLFDGYDGSGFDVWAVTSDSLVMVPRLKSTEAAIERLISHMFETYREGTVTDAHVS
jgi:hypothetical protein